MCPRQANSASLVLLGNLCLLCGVSLLEDGTREQGATNVDLLDPLEVDSDEDRLKVLEEGEELKSGEASPEFSFRELNLTHQVFRIVISISFVDQ